MHLPAPNDVRRPLRPCVAASLATSRELAAPRDTDGRPSHEARPEAAATGAVVQVIVEVWSTERAVTEHNALIHASGAHELFPAQLCRLTRFLVGQRAGVELHLVADRDVDVNETTDLGSGDSFLEIARSLASCGRDAG